MLVSGRVTVPGSHTLTLDSKFVASFWQIMASQLTPLTYPPRNKGLIAGLIKGNQRLMSPDHKAGYFFGGGYVWGGLVDQS